MHPSRPLLAIGMMLAASTASAHDADRYPQRPITVIVAYAPGAGTDIAARTMAPFLERYLGGNIVVVNRPGAGGQIGFTELSRAQPDGYTIGFINTPNILAIAIERNAHYSLDSFAPIANIVDDPGALSVRADSQFQTLGELAAYARQHPGALTYGTNAVRGDDHLAMLAFERDAGVTLQHVPFSGTVTLRNSMLGGFVMAGSFNMGDALQAERDGLIRILGQMGEERWSRAPDVPTFREQGFDVISGSQRALAAPAGTPPAIIARLSAAVEQTINDPEFQARAREQDLPLRYLGPDDLGELLRRQDVELRTSLVEASAMN